MGFPVPINALTPPRSTPVNIDVSRYAVTMKYYVEYKTKAKHKRREKENNKEREREQKKKVSK